MNEEYPVHWLEEIIQEILARDVERVTLSTGKTPSGHIHLGILREIIICDSLRRIFEDRGDPVRNILFFDSLDAAKRFPAYIPKNFQSQHLGKPFSIIPCPFEDCNCKSYAHHFGKELVDTFPDFGIKTEIIWTHELYKTKEMQENLKIALDNINNIKKILRKYLLPTIKDEDREEFIEMQKEWMPVMAICEECNRTLLIMENGSIKPNRIKKYHQDLEEVEYLCEACGHKGNLSIWSGRLKLNWRIDWPAKWALFNTTCEPAGKDHSVKGGAYDTGIELCKTLYGYQGPVKVPYEWLRLGNQDMGTSKGIVFTPKKYLELADPEVYRTTILRTNPNKHIAFRIEELPQYYDYYERMENIYYDLEKSETKEESEFLKYMYPLTQIKQVPEKKPQKLPLKLLIFLVQIQNILPFEKLYAKAKQFMSQQSFEKLIPLEDFRISLKKTENWINEVKKIIKNQEDPKKVKEIKRKIDIFTIPEKIDKGIINKLEEDQLQALIILKDYIKQNESLEGDKIQNEIFNIAKGLKISNSKMFKAIYQILLGKSRGPKAGPFLEMLDRDWLLNRLEL